MDNPKPVQMDQSQYFDTAIRAVSEKKPVPEMDFTLHTMEDGQQVSTQDRVCKGKISTHSSSMKLANRML